MFGPPSPGPLPQKREDRPAVAGESERPRFFVRRIVKINWTAIAPTQCEISRSTDDFSLSPGERAGVRASVKTNFGFLSKHHRCTAPSGHVTASDTARRTRRRRS